MSDHITEHSNEVLQNSIVWDNHVYMPLRPGDEEFLPQLERHKNSGVSVIVLNVVFDLQPWHAGFTMLATFRHWISRHSDQYALVETVEDIERAVATGKLAIAFNIEGGRAVEEHPGLVDVFYKLGVRWMLIAYNKNNLLGGGCQDNDSGLTDYGRLIIDEMERVGMVLCCTHTGYRTAREAMEYSRNPVIFSHSNPRALWDHPRNIPDDLIVACARTGGVVNINGMGIFLGDNDNSTQTLLKHIDYVANLVGPEHVGLGLDYMFDQQELDDYIESHPDLFPPDKGYRTGIHMVEPERIPSIAEGLLRMNYSEQHVKGIMGLNNFRVACKVWK